MTLVVLGVDALDSALVDEFDVDGLRLSSSTQMETVAHVRDEPYTPEAWATVATGLHPREHGISTGTSEWDNPVVDFLSNYAGRLSMSWRSKLGNLIEETIGAEYTIAEVDAPTIFDGDDRIVHNWPGVHNGDELKRAWNIMWREGQTEAEFERDILGLAAEQFGWVREMLEHDVAVAGIHIHLLDATGHAYCDQPEQLRHSYERAESFVQEVESRLGPEDDLLVLSDHGMVVDFYADEDDRDHSPGRHSWRAFASSTVENVPESVFEVYDWVETHVETTENSANRLDIDEERLRDLGYI